MKFNIFKKKPKGEKEQKEEVKEEKKEPEVAAGAKKVRVKKDEVKEEKKPKPLFFKKLFGKKPKPKEKEEIKEKKEPEVAAGAKKEEEKKGNNKKLEKHMYKSVEKLRGLKHDKLFAKKKKKKRFSMRGFAKAINLQSYLDKAGFELNAKLVSKKIFRINIFICLGISFIVILMNLIFKKGFINLLTFLIGFWLTVSFFLLILIWIVYLFYIDMKIFERTKAVEAVFPNFLQLTSSNISAGMPIDRALWYSIRPGFGVLAKEIENVAKNTMAGEDLSSALISFADKYDSKIIRRSISLLLEGMDAGGKIADLLNKIALDIDETRILKKEMGASVTTYVIFITFATIVAAPVLFGLATQLLVIIQDITASMGQTIGASSSFFSLSFSSESIKISDFKIFSFLMLGISSFSSACIVSIIKKGRVKEGLSKIPVFIIVSITIYLFSITLMKSLFGNII